MKVVSLTEAPLPSNESGGRRDVEVIFLALTKIAAAGRLMTPSSNRPLDVGHV